MWYQPKEIGGMEGVYVDADARLVLVYAHAPDDYSVYLAHGNDAATMTNKRIVRLKEMDVTHEGFYNGSDCIVFEDGRKWRRVDMSYAQFRLLTSRPYVPLSFMAVRILHGVMNRVIAAVTEWRTEGK
jgi:hypothetical protein